MKELYVVLNAMKENVKRKGVKTHYKKFNNWCYFKEKMKKINQTNGNEMESVLKTLG